MAKIPYLIRRKNVFYFRLSVPTELRDVVKCREIIQTLKTQDSEEAGRRALKLAAHFKSLLHDLKTGKADKFSRVYVITAETTNTEAQSTDNRLMKRTQEAINLMPPLVYTENQNASQKPLLSIVINDFLNHYDQRNKSTYIKLVATLPLLIELIGDKPINQLLQTDLNSFFDTVQKLPVKRKQKAFAGLTTKEIIEANAGKRIAEGTFESTYKACTSIFLSWAIRNYHDQGFPSLSVQGAIYRGNRHSGINKQRAASIQELKMLFNNPKMRGYAKNTAKVHYWWLPLIGLYTGARINEICQLNPHEDIKQDQVTGIWYFHFTDESPTSDDVEKSIKTNSSRRIVPIHSKLIDSGFLDYVERIKNCGHKIIFPAWKPRNGKASANAAKWFVKFLASVGLRSEEQGLRLSGFHLFRHTFVTYGITNRIQRTFDLTGHETSEAEGMKLSSVAKGYWTRNPTDNIQELKTVIEQFDFSLTVFCSIS